jgi:acetyl-CoA carboxylase carboxyltransferase component
VRGRRTVSNDRGQTNDGADRRGQPAGSPDRSTTDRPIADGPSSDQSTPDRPSSHKSSPHRTTDAPSAQAGDTVDPGGHGASSPEALPSEISGLPPGLAPGLADTPAPEMGAWGTDLLQPGRTEVSRPAAVLTTAAVTQTLPPQPGRGRDVVVRTGPVSFDGRPVVTARVQDTDRGRSLSGEAAGALASAAALALERRLPLVAWLSAPGLDLNAGVAALDGWGRVAQSFARCSGVVPIVIVLNRPVLSGPALLLGMADAVIMTPASLSYLSGPAAVEEVTGFAVRPEELGGPAVHASRSGLATLVVSDDGAAVEAVARLLDFLPAHSDELAPARYYDDPPSRPTPELRDVVPDSSTGSYDVRRVLTAIADDGDVFELRPSWAPQLVTAFVRVAGQPVGVLANQPQAMAGTLDIAASQKGARFVAFCDSFNLPLLTIVDSPGFMPGRDLEWRGMIRHGAELVFAYAEATVPRICLVVRKAYGGAYIVMDSKAMGNDLCVAWPSAELAVMGAEGAVRIVHRREDEGTQAKLAVEYRDRFLNPYIAAERGFVDLVIDPAETRETIARCLSALRTKRESLVVRNHGNTPL